MLACCGPYGASRGGVSSGKRGEDRRAAHGPGSSSSSWRRTAGRPSPSPQDGYAPRPCWTCPRSRRKPGGGDGVGAALLPLLVTPTWGRVVVALACDLRLSAGRAGPLEWATHCPSPAEPPTPPQRDKLLRGLGGSGVGTTQMIDDQGPKIEPDTPWPITGSRPRSRLCGGPQLSGPQLSGPMNRLLRKAAGRYPCSPGK